MTTKQREHYLLFLTEKLGKLVARGDPSIRTAFAGPHVAAILTLAKRKRLTLADIKSVDAEIELMSRGAISRRELDDAIVELKRQFGFGRLVEDPDCVVKRVIERGKIANRSEYRVVLGALAYVGDDFVSARDRTTLDGIFRKYEGR